MSKEEKEKFVKESRELEEIAKGAFYVIPSFSKKPVYDFKSAREYCKKNGKKSLSELSVKEREMFAK
jgi:hypothetical protein